MMGVRAGEQARGGKGDGRRRDGRWWLSGGVGGWMPRRSSSRPHGTSPSSVQVYEDRAHPTPTNTWIDNTKWTYDAAQPAHVSHVGGSRPGPDPAAKSPLQWGPPHAGGRLEKHPASADITSPAAGLQPLKDQDVTTRAWGGTESVVPSAPCPVILVRRVRRSLAAKLGKETVLL